MSMTDIHLDTAKNRIERGTTGAIAEAQVHATLAVVEALNELIAVQREATAWAKEQIVVMRQAQEDFLAEIRTELARP